MAVAGGLFSGMGLIMHLSLNSFKNMATGMFGNLGIGFSEFGSPEWGDLYFGPYADMYEQQVNNILSNNPMSIIAWAVLIFGIVLLFGGIILAVVLKNKGREGA